MRRDTHAQRAVGTRKVVDLAKLIDFIQDKMQFMIHPDQRLRENGQRFARRARFVRVKEEQNHVRTLGEPAHDLGELIASIRVLNLVAPAILLLRRARRVDGFRVPLRWVEGRRRARGINHAGTIYQHVVGLNPLPHFELRALNERWTIPSQAREAQVGVPHQRGSVLVQILVAGGNDRKAVVRGRDARGLHVPLQQVVNEGRFPRRVVP
ncbi:hypothetical protein PsorP6_011267 [Peronosclerospora sorghi]|uniref:Uncharacterized protein n=1 Tax=Peronosclerospora sorghi TaxID=230839 RepID=A0ACC0WM54_9STRA|nr:hypothetical protein PsorP6_011267 [Peronosclerospora sorghi]